MPCPHTNNPEALKTGGHGKPWPYTPNPEWRYSVEKNILAQMKQEYDSFTRSERKIADYVLKHQKETQYISITDLSAECEVAVSTVSLFCRKLKLAGFNDFKLELARASLPAGGRPPGGPHGHGPGAPHRPGGAEQRL